MGRNLTGGFARGLLEAPCASASCELRRAGVVANLSAVKK